MKIHRIPKCCCPNRQQEHNQDLRERLARNRYRSLDRTHCDFEIFWPCQQLYHQPVSGDGCHWCHKYFGTVPWSLSCHRFVLSNGYQVEGWSAHPICWRDHCRCCATRNLRSPCHVLLHPQRRSLSCYYSRRW
jgi:hypothetical protein